MEDWPQLEAAEVAAGMGGRTISHWLLEGVRRARLRLEGRSVTSSEVTLAEEA